MRRPPSFLVLCVAGILAACSRPPTPAAPVAATSAETVTAPQPVDEAGLRLAASEALSEQRYYAPVADNAIEYYLALRELRPDDRDLSTALLELLPYALIASEQAIAREDFGEARRLLALIEQADPQAPSLLRLRDGIAEAEAAAARRVVAEAEAAKRAVLESEAAATARARDIADAASAERAPAPAESTPAPTAPAAAVIAPVSPRLPEPVRAVPVAPAVPRLLSAPPPRYPLVAIRRRIEGSVTVQFTIQPDGSVASASVADANPPGVFDEAALTAARRWRFEAVAAPVRTTREVRFRLGEAAD